MLTAVDGSTFEARQLILDEDEQVVMPGVGYPKVLVKDHDGLVITRQLGTPGQSEGEWVANLALPNMGIAEKVELRVVWIMRDVDDEKFVFRDTLVVEPRQEARDDDVVAVFGDAKFSFTIPEAVKDEQEVTYSVYADNQNISGDVDCRTDTQVKMRVLLDKTVVSAPMCSPNPSLSASLLRVNVANPGDLPKMYTYKLWAVTPQILLGMQHLESFLNKSRIENTIPELRYNPGDLMNYLERGLYLFNMCGGTTPTTFNGTNMQGPLFEAWVLCSLYYALGAQLLAEGSLSFDFSGQGVSLNVDRTPQLDGAIGRIENQIQTYVVPLKKQLAKQNILTGDGSVGKIGFNNPRSIGTLSVINAATTRFPYPGSALIGRRL